MRKLLLMGAILLSQLVSTTQVQAIEVEGRVAWLIPTEKRIRDVYGKSGYPEYQLEVATALGDCCDCCCGMPITAFVNVSYFEKTGHTRCKFENSTLPQAVLDSLCEESGCFRNKSKLEHWLITGGAKYYFDCFECIRPYLGFGLGAGGARFRDHSRNLNGPNVIVFEEQPRERHNREKWGFAILAKSGIEYDVTCNIFLDAFLDYSHTWFSKEKRHCTLADGSSSSSRHSLDFGAVKLGLGVGYRF